MPDISFGRTYIKSRPKLWPYLFHFSLKEKSMDSYLLSYHTHLPPLANSLSSLNVFQLLLHKTLMEMKISFDALSLIFRRGNQNSKQAYSNIWNGAMALRVLLFWQKPYIVSALVLQKFSLSSVTGRMQNIRSRIWKNQSRRVLNTVSTSRLLTLLSVSWRVHVIWLFSCAHAWTEVVSVILYYRKFKGNQILT